ncbi:hypothetical protein MKX03_002750, partial [Papaver bracteatum]
LKSALVKGMVDNSGKLFLIWIIFEAFGRYHRRFCKENDEWMSEVFIFSVDTLRVVFGLLNSLACYYDASAQMHTGLPKVEKIILKILAVLGMVGAAIYTILLFVCVGSTDPGNLNNS